MSTIPQISAFLGTPQVVAPRITEPMAKRWTRQEYHRLGEQGWFEGQRVELIDGEIILLSPQSPQHCNASERVRRLRDKAFGEQYWVRRQAPIVHGEYSEPEPDVCVVRGSLNDFAESHPASSLLIVEVSLSSIKYDYCIKHSLYASMGLQEYWILDLVNRRLIVHGDPRPDSSKRFGACFSSIVDLDESQQVSPLEKPDAQIAIRELLPPAPLMNRGKMGYRLSASG